MAVYRFGSLIFFVVVATISAEKPDYVYYPEVKLHYRFFNGGLSWLEARQKCLSQNATLAMPKNEEEAKALVSILDHHPGVNAEYIHLGFHDAFSEGEYLANDGNTIQYYYHKWVTGQPDNYHNEDCGTLHRSGKLNDNSCGAKLPFVCQKDSKDTLKDLPNFNCISNDPAYIFEPHLKKCYKIHLDPKTWEVARAICHAEGGHLAMINNKAEEDFLVTMFNNPENSVLHVPDKEYALLGFHDLFHEGHYMTVTGEDLSSLPYVRWLKGQPDNYKGNENCGSMHTSGALNDYYCGNPAIFFCEQFSNPDPPFNVRFDEEQ